MDVLCRRIVVDMMNLQYDVCECVFVLLLLQLKLVVVRVAEEFQMAKTVLRRRTTIDPSFHNLHFLLLLLPMPLVLYLHYDQLSPNDFVVLLSSFVGALLFLLAVFFAVAARQCHHPLFHLPVVLFLQKLNFLGFHS